MLNILLMKKERKTILEYIKGLFRKGTGEELSGLPAAPTEETVKRLVGRTLGEKLPAEEGHDASGNSHEDASGKSDESNYGGSDHGSDAGGDGGGDRDDEPKRESCPYATKRAIVESIDEIRRFAEEHKLAASVLRSLLSLLGEIALGAIKGKVSRQILELLLKAINYELAIDEAFRKGHDDGLQQGHDEGLEKGREEGLEEGRKVGHEEGRKIGHEEGRKVGHEEGRKIGHEEGRKAWIEERFPLADDGLPHINGSFYRADITSIFDVAAEAMHNTMHNS